MERQEKMMRAMEQILPAQFEKSCEKITENCETRSQEMVSEFLAAIKQVMDRAVVLQKFGEKGKIKYLMFSYLHSGMFLGRDFIRVDVMDQGFYNDQAESAAYLNLNGIYGCFEEDMTEIKKEMFELCPRIRKYEMDLIRYEYEIYYHQATEEFIRVMLMELGEETLLAGIEREDKVQILFGEYMDSADVLLVLEGGENR